MDKKFVFRSLDEMTDKAFEEIKAAAMGYEKIKITIRSSSVSKAAFADFKKALAEKNIEVKVSKV